MSNKYDVEIKDGENIYTYKNIDLENVEEILKEHPNYSELNAKQEKGEDKNE